MATRTTKPALAETGQMTERPVQACTHEGQWQHAETVMRSGTFESTAYSVLYCKNCGTAKAVRHADLLTGESAS